MTEPDGAFPQQNPLSSQHNHKREEKKLLAQLRRLGWGSLVIYALLLTPTVMWAIYAFPEAGAFNHHSLATERWLWDSWANAWDCTFWHLPGLTGRVGQSVLDVLRVSAIGALGWFFYQGYQRIDRHTKDQALSPQSQKTLTRLIWGWTLMAGVILIPVIPFHSSDLYGYLNRGFQQSLLHTNPYLTPIADIPGWAGYPFLQPHWIDNPCPYGFVFASLMRGLTALCGTNFVLAVLLMKLVNLSVLAMMVVLLARLAGVLKHARPWLTVYAFAANPIVLLHLLGNGHNDSLMILPLLASILAIQSGRWRWVALPLLTISILVKYLSLLAAPFILLYLIRKRSWRDIGIGVLLSLCLGFIVAQPYLPTPGQSWPWHDMLDNAGKPQHSLIAMLSIPLALLPGIGGTAPSALKAGLTLAFIVFYGWLLKPFFRKGEGQPGLQQLVEIVALAMLAFVVVVSAKFHPWYILMFLPLTLLLPEAHFARRFALTFGFFQLAAFTFVQNIPVINAVLLTVLPFCLIRRQTSLFNSKPASPRPD